MISDSFPPEKRARPLGVYATGAIIGVGLALIIGGGGRALGQLGAARRPAGPR